MMITYPKTLLHLTPTKNVENILKHGIKVSSKRTSSGGDIKGVYLTNHPAGVILGETLVGGSLPKNLSIITVSTKGLELELDPEFYSGDVSHPNLPLQIKRGRDIYAYSKKSIPASKIISVEKYDQKLTAALKKLSSNFSDKLKSFQTRIENELDIIMEVYLKEELEAIVLSSIFIKKEDRKAGTGTKAMERLVEFADDNSLIIVLTPSRDFGATSVSRLRKFYGRFGFKRNLGRNKDYRFMEAMIRTPK